MRVRTWNFSDGCNNTSANFVQTITVEDNTAPSVTTAAGSLDATLECSNAAGISAALAQEPAATDNCTSPTLNLVSDVTTPDATCANAYVRVRTWNFSDGCNNTSANFVQTITVEDNTAPTASNPGSISVQCPSDVPLPDITVVTDEADNCTVNPVVAFVSDVSDGNSNPEIITRTYSVTDDCGNAINVTQTITIDDTVDPVISNCPVDIDVSNDSGNCSAVVTWIEPSATDNCTIAGSLTWSKSHLPGATFPVGTTTVTYTVTDEAGNASSCSFDVTVNDTENPTISCPENITTNNAGGDCSAGVAISTPFSDNCSGSSLTWTMTGAETNSGSGPIGTYTFPVGTTTITATVTDTSGNTASCSFSVTVNDNEPPTVACLSDINESNDTGECFAVVTFADPTATDNCGVASIIQTAGLSSGAQFPVGTTTITYRVTDINGLFTDCTFNVNVTDDEDPVIPTLPDLTDECSVTISSAPETTDNCFGTVTGTTGDFTIPYTFNAQGTHTITWEFDDENGNVIFVDQTVIIEDLTDPVPDLESLTDYTLANGNAQYECELYLDIPTATDNCRGNINGVPMVNGVEIDFPITTYGTFNITWTYDDRNGHVVTQQQIVENIEPPISGGRLLGQVDDLDPVEFPPTNNVLIAACPDNINPVTIDLDLYNGTIVRWEKFEVDANNWTDIANTTTTYHVDFDITNSVTTLFRVLIQYNSCFEYSQVLSVQTVPPDVPPTLDNDYFNSCYPEEISLTAYSGYGGDIIDLEDEEAGQFDQGQFPDKWNPNMWLIDGQVAGVSFTGAANNRSVNNWTATNDHPFPDGTWTPKITYDSNNFKFAIAQGDFTSQEYLDNFPDGGATTLETPIMSLLGLDSPTISFTSAWNLDHPDDIALFEISLDGGLTYTEVLMDLWVVTPDGEWDWASYPPSSQYNYEFGTSVWSFPLDAYTSYDQVRFRWTYFGNSPFSAWAIDEITLPLGGSPADEIEWTDGIGNPTEEPLADGTLNVTYTFTPDAPGYHQYGATVLVNGCRAYDPAGTALADVIQNYAYAGENILYDDDECGENIVTLNAYDNTKTAIENAAKGAFTLPVDCINCDNPGTMSPGKWTVVNSPTGCGTSYSFSDDTDPDATFTGDPGVYTLRWTVGPFGLNNDGFCSDDVLIEITNCSRVDFDGENDNVTFRNNYNLDQEFSIECWIKPDDTTNLGMANNAIQTIISKRDYTDFNNSGYDLRLEGSTLSFNWNNTGVMVCPYNIGTDRWYHIAVTRTKDGKNYRMYVDGILVASTTGNPPGSNNNECILGAMDQTGNPPNAPLNYFSGWIDEVRIWNIKLEVDQIRQMMNQQIDDFGGAVMGEVVPLVIDGPDADGDGADDNPISWSDLVGYYRMNEINCGYLGAYTGGIDGKLRNITTQQEESAPLPYTTKASGNWDDTTASTPWTYGDTVWDYPNSTGVTGDPIDWNIVRTGHDVTSDAQDVTLLGLLVDSNELTVTNTGVQDETNPGHALYLTHYLKLDGLIDLIGESQLIQKRYYFDDDGNPNNDDVTHQLNGSVIDVASSGHLERDQQGQSNLYNYNYWSSPVSYRMNGVNGTYILANVLKDGSDTNNPLPLQWTGGRDADPNTTPITLSRRWLYMYKNDPTNIYANWEKIQEGSSIPHGLSFIMKGSGAVGDEQNYVFDGLPYNGTITNPITFGNEALVGNPYPSAIDARDFILDNIPGGNPGTSASFDGALYFWVHYNTNDTHILRDYQGGYAQLTLAGGNPAAAPPITIDGYEISGLGNSNKMPEYYVPVGQGFFVYAVEPGSGGDVTFHNKHRVFQTEQDGESVFMKSAVKKTDTASGTPEETSSDSDDDIQRVRLLFRTPEGNKRPLLLAFTPDNAATDGFDFGYDAENKGQNPDDMLFRIGERNFTIQGVAAFDETKQYPLVMYSENGGRVEVHLMGLENLPKNTKVYIYDALLGTYSKINNKAFDIVLDPGIYLNRFYVAFLKNNALTVADALLDQIGVNYLQDSKEIYIRVNNDVLVKKVQLKNMIGQTIKTWNGNLLSTFSNEIRLPVDQISEGGYIIDIQTDKGSVHKKMVINQY
ncbi:HYR domain-containing protein [Aestuariivivens sediminicola]|uniref:HYR domain-containing protein n=1 Tax=Aestuariivivens sediminicola TaxID=2913560 RepID=UPI001F58E15D|nr:HYR domain-containing protein [Aestuariivivens sediminicola]